MNRPRPRRGHSNPYRVLGVNTSASQQDITRAYRRAAQRMHPDTQPQDPQASARFRALAAAYDLLRDPDRRADYDRLHAVGEPTGHPVEPGPSSARPHAPGVPYLLSLAPGQPVWAGPVHVEPPTAAGQQGQGGNQPTARFEDPPIILGWRLSPKRNWPR